MRRWFRPWPIVWFVWIVSRAIDRPSVGIPLVALAGAVVAVIYFVKWLNRPKPEVVFVADASPPPRLSLAGARCLICRHELATDVIYCGRCHTPHHRECFAYTGGCSVYACASAEVLKC